VNVLRRLSAEARDEAKGVSTPPEPPLPARPRQPRLLRSAALRFALVYTLLLAVSAGALAMFLWWATAGLLDRQTAAAIDADAQVLVERFEDGGTMALRLSIDERLDEDVDGNALYLLADPALRPLDGNLAAWPRLAREPGIIYKLPLQRPGGNSLGLVKRFDLMNGDHLLVGRDVHTRVLLRRLLTDALLWGLIVVFATASAGGFVVRSLFRRTLASVSATAQAIAAGDFTRRVTVSPRGDEFDQLAETINDMLDRIARLMDGVRQVSNAIAHDLRTPITRARARLEEAATHAESAPELRAAVERATTDLDGIVAVFQALLRIAEIEAGSRRSAFAAIDLVPLLADVVELYGPVAEGKDLRLDVDIPELLPAYGDRELIQQAVANLVDNAVKFSPEGGAVEVSATATPAGAEIVVADQGPGIPPADRERATERFYRGETARSTPGAGLGLALVQAVAQLHGGTLILEDDRPGLRARLRLPAQDSQTQGF
jgi:signal transduction histidine kinase